MSAVSARNITSRAKGTRCWPLSTQRVVPVMQGFCARNRQVAATCLFLAQNPCITGTTLCVDNGQHLVPLARDVMFLADKKDAS